MRGQLGVARLGERRLRETIDRYGLETLLAVFAEKLDRTEARVRAALRGSGPTASSKRRSANRRRRRRRDVRYHVRVEKRGDRLPFDFSRSSDQVAMPINVRPSIVRGCIAFALIGLIDPTIENNGGLDARRRDLQVRPRLDPRSGFPGADQRLHEHGDGAVRARRSRR